MGLDELVKVVNEHQQRQSQRLVDCGATPAEAEAFIRGARMMRWHLLAWDPNDTALEKVMAAECERLKNR